MKSEMRCEITYLFVVVVVELLFSLQCLEDCWHDISYEYQQRFEACHKSVTCIT